MSLTVKAFLYRRSWREDPLEIRRFSLDQDVSSSYSYLVQKLAQVFPSVSAEEIILAWADADGDYINISSDAELLEALDQFDGSIFKIHLKKRELVRCPQPVFCAVSCQPPQPPAPPTKQGGDEKMEEGGDAAAKTGSEAEPAKAESKEGPHHIGVVCDGCSCEIFGVRYKCLVCPDYDLCSTCERKGEHVDHNMVSIRDPLAYSPWGPSPWGPHRGGFGGPWRGRRGHHCGGRGRHGGAWVPPYFLQNLLGGELGGCARGSAGQQPPAADKKPEGKSEEMDTEQQQQAAGESTSEQEQLEREQRQSYLQDIGQAVSNFLRPFGVKVDVDVVDEEGQPKTAEPTTTDTSADPEPSAPSKVPSGYDGNTLYPTLDAATSAPPSDTEPDPVEAVVAQLRGMGFDNEGGWLTELVRAKGGDIGKVLDALHPSQPE